jgi:ferredoxin-nitrate reductase
MVEIESRRGKAQAPARIGDILPGHVFIPFHFGYWDDSDRPRAANELTLTEWDPVSKQPYFKFAAVRLRKLVPVTAGQRMGQMAHRVMEQARETFTSQEARSPSETPWPSS